MLSALKRIKAWRLNSHEENCCLGRAGEGGRFQKRHSRWESRAENKEDRKNMCKGPEVGKWWHVQGTEIRYVLKIELTRCRRGLDAGVRSKVTPRFWRGAWDGHRGKPLLERRSLGAWHWLFVGDLFWISGHGKWPPYRLWGKGRIRMPWGLTHVWRSAPTVFLFPRDFWLWGWRECIFHVDHLLQLWLCDTVLIKMQHVQKEKKEQQEQSMALWSTVMVLTWSNRAMDPSGIGVPGLTAEMPWKLIMELVCLMNMTYGYQKEGMGNGE